MPTIDADSRDIVHAIERHDGQATTTQIRRETGLENSSVRYRYEKLEDLGLITTERDPDATPEGVAAVTVAILTEKGREEIDKGLTAEAKLQRAKIEPVDNAERIEDLEDEVQQLREAISGLHHNLNLLREKVEE